jgi:hypothetical protein
MILLIAIFQLVNSLCPEIDSFCVTLSRNCYTVYSKFDGWTGFGIGSKTMRGANM